MIVYITMYCEILQVFKIKSKYLRLHSQKKSRNFFPEKFLLFFKVRKDCFMNLYPAHIVFGNVAGNITFADGVSVRKGHNARDRVDFRHYEALVLLHFPGFI